MLKILLSLTFITTSLYCHAMEKEIDRESRIEFPAFIKHTSWENKIHLFSNDIGCNLIYHKSWKGEKFTIDIESTLYPNGFSLKGGYNTLCYALRYVIGNELQIEDYELLGMLAVAGNMYPQTIAREGTPIIKNWTENFLWLHSFTTPNEIITQFKNTHPECNSLYLFAPTLSLTTGIQRNVTPKDPILQLYEAGIDLLFVPPDGNIRRKSGSEKEEIPSMTISW